MDSTKRSARIASVGCVSGAGQAIRSAHRSATRCADRTVSEVPQLRGSPALALRARASLRLTPPTAVHPDAFVPATISAAMPRFPSNDALPASRQPECLRRVHPNARRRLPQPVASSGAPARSHGPIVDTTRAELRSRGRRTIESKTNAGQWTPRARGVDASIAEEFMPSLE